MKIQEYNQMMKHLTRPSRKATEEKVRKEMNLDPKTKINGSKILNWINYNNKLTGTNNLPITAEEKSTAAEIEKAMYPPEASDLQMANLKKRIDNARAYVSKPKVKEKWKYESWADGLEERTRPAKKAPVKIVKKPTVLELLEIEDWLNTIDPNYWIPEEKPKPKPEDKTRIIRTGITKLI